MRKRNSRIKANDPCHCGSGLKFKRCHGTQRSSSSKLSLHRELIAPLLPRIAITYTAKEIFERTLSWNEAKHALAQINAESALLTMAMLNAVSSEFSEKLSGTPKDRRWIESFVHYLLPPEYRAKALQSYDENAQKTFIPLSPQACIAMTEACARYCDRSGGLRFEQPHQSPTFALILFSFQGMLARPGLFSRPYSFSQLSDEQFSSLARGYLGANYNSDLSGAILRHHLQFGSTEPVQRLRGISPSEWFEEVTGIPPDMFAVISVFFMHPGGDFSLEKPDLTKLVFSPDVMLRDIVADAADIFRRLIESAKLKYEEIDASKAPANWDEAVFSQHYIRRKPILGLIDGAYICLHRQMMLEKFLIAMPHLLTELVAEHPQSGASPSRAQRIKQLRIDLGYIFESYVSRLLRAYFPDDEARCRFSYAGPAGNERDGLIIIKRYVLLFEFVHHPWSLSERSTGAIEGYVGHLKDNILKLHDVSDAIQSGRFLNDEIDSNYCIVPVVILLEPVPISDMTAETFLRRLAEQEGCISVVTGAGRILPLQLLSLTQLEAIDLFIPKNKGSLTVANFLASRARDPLRRVTAEPGLGQTIRDEYDRFAKDQECAEEVFRSLAPKVFRRGSERV